MDVSYRDRVGCVGWTAPEVAIELAIGPLTCPGSCDELLAQAICAHMCSASPTLREQILDSALVSIICLDLKGRINFANPAAARTLGCSIADELHGQPILVRCDGAGATKEWLAHLNEKVGMTASLLFASGLYLASRKIEEAGREVQRGKV